MLLQGERISRDYVQEWVEVRYSFLNDKDTPYTRNFTKDGGAFRYQSDHAVCLDRWIIWRIKDDCVELSELSLHLNLSGNGLRLYFPNTTVLSPIVIVEEGLTLSILIATTASVHRIICPHPATQQSDFMGTVKTHAASVLESVDTTVLQTKHHFSYIPHDVAPSLGTAALSQIGAAVFAFSYPSADLRLVTLPPPGTDAAVLQTDLHQWSVMQRLWSGVSRRSAVSECESAPLSLTMYQLGPDMLLFSLCKDVKLRVWSLNNKECINIEVIPSKTPLKMHGNQSLTFKPATSSTTAMLGMHLSFTDASVFRVYTVLYNDDHLNMTLFFNCSGWDMPLKHFYITAQKILALHNESGTPRVLTLALDNSENEGSWNEAQLIEPSELDEEIFDDKNTFVEVCLSEFTENTICAALDKLSFDFEEGTVEDTLTSFVTTHEGMEDLEEAMRTLYKECSTFHELHSSPVSVSDGVLVMAGDLTLLLPNSSDYYVNENSTLMTTFVKLTEFIPADRWEMLQDCPEMGLTDIASDLICNHIMPENAAELDELILSIEDISVVLRDAVRSIHKYQVSSCSLPTLFRSVAGSECLIRAVDTGVFDAHKTYAVLLVCLVYIEQEQEGVSEETQALIRTSLIPDCVQIMNRFSLLQWILSAPVEPEPAEYDNFGNLTISESVDTKPKTILHHYLASRHPQMEYMGLEEMKKTVVAFINAMYPGSKLLDLPQFLLSSHYFDKLKEYYTRSENCSVALKHIAAQAYAATGEDSTAVKVFISVAKNIDMSSTLLTNFIGTPDPAMPLSLQYITKCIAMLERSGLHKSIFTLASQATKFAEKQHLPLLYSLAFKHAVEAGNFDQAYKAMSLNPCPSQKHSCLKRFVVVMVEAGLAKRLVNYPYHGFKAEIVSVLEFKARNSDLRQNHNYYNLLFAFHVQNKMYQHAAAAAYEHVLRLQNEVPGPSSLKKQLFGYLSAISCLELLRQQDAWILEPTQYSDVRVAVNASPKRPRSSNERSKKASTKLALVTVKELRAGYLLVDSLVKISAIKPDSAKLHNLSPAEVLGLLCNCGLFDQAFLLASYHELPPPLASLTSRCINVAQHFSTHNHLPPGLTEWLNHNNIPNTDELSPPDRAWLYLQSKVTASCSLSTSTNWEALKQVLSQMLSAPFPPPFWLLKLCKQVNPEATIRICAQYDSLKLAVQLAIGYIGAVAGRETEDFGLENSLQSNLPPVYVPYTVFDQVLLQLKHKTDKSSAELYKDLVDQINVHLDLLERVSADNTFLNRDKLLVSMT